MTPDRTWDPIRFQRGTRAFAALITLINGAIVLGIALVVAPAADLPHPLAAWVIGLTLAIGIGHLVAVVGLVRATRWAASLVAYLAAAGIGASVFAMLLVTRAELDVLGAGGPTTAAFLAWMAAWWLLATRFALQAAATPAYVIRPTRNVTFA